MIFLGAPRGSPLSQEPQKQGGKGDAGREATRLADSPQTRCPFLDLVRPATRNFPGLRGSGACGSPVLHGHTG